MLKRFVAIALALNLLILGAFAATNTLQAADETVSGTFYAVWGDDYETGTVQLAYHLQMADGTRITVAVDSNFDPFTYNRQGVTLHGSYQGDMFIAQQIVADPAVADAPRISGSQPYVTIMCEFPGDDSGTSEMAPLAFFQDMYFGSPSLDEYWREQSYEAINLTGSQAYGWYTMPNSQSSYLNNGSPNLNAIYNDCVTAASGNVNVNNFAGVSLMLDEEFGCCAWGGGGTTWNPPWAWKNTSVIKHEMGHAFGLPHSNNYDGDGDPYDNPWDVMSAAFDSTNVDSNYGIQGVHTNIYYKDALNWITPGETYTYSAPGATIDLDYSALGTTSNTRMIVIPGAGVYDYYVEARFQQGYDSGLPGEAVIIHEVYTGRTEWAWLIGGSSDAASAGASAMWTVGETWTTPEGVDVTINSKTATGFNVTIGDPVTVTNLLENGSFEDDTNVDTVPDSWVMLNTAPLNGEKQYCNGSVAFDGSCMMLFSGDDMGIFGVRQEIDPTASGYGSAGDLITLTFQVRGRDVPLDAEFIGSRLFVKNETTLEKERMLCSVGDRGTFGWAEATCTITPTIDYDLVRVDMGLKNMTSGFLVFDLAELMITAAP